MTTKVQTAVFYAVLVCTAGVLWMVIAGHRSLSTLTYSKFLEQVRAGQIVGVTVSANNSTTQATCRRRC
jgi:hypothetical protein